MPTSTRNFGKKNTGQLFHLPVRSRTLSLREAAIYLGLTPSRLRTLAFLGTGPERHRSSKGATVYQRDALDHYVATLHERAGISTAETIRRRAERAPARDDALRELLEDPNTILPEPDPFMMLATNGEVCEHGVFLMLKVLALFGFIMLCISSTPLLRAHFNQ